MTLADASDLEDRGYTGPASPRVQKTRLGEAWRALQVEVTDLVANLAAGVVDHDVVIDVLCAAALRVLRNPEGAESQSTAIDDYSETVKLADSSADLYFTAAELRRVRPVPTGDGTYTGSWRYQ